MGIIMVVQRKPYFSQHFQAAMFRDRDLYFTYERLQILHRSRSPLTWIDLNIVHTTKCHVSTTLLCRIKIFIDIYNSFPLRIGCL